MIYDSLLAIVGTPIYTVIVFTHACSYYFFRWAPSGAILLGWLLFGVQLLFRYNIYYLQDEAVINFSRQTKMNLEWSKRYDIGTEWLMEFTDVIFTFFDKRICNTAVKKIENYKSK